MIEILIKLKPSFSPKGYLFGCSKTNNESTVTNWQDGKNAITVDSDGTWYCFARKKNSNNVSVFIVNVNCGNIENPICTINGIHPYQLNQGDSVVCNITGIQPYILSSNGTNSCTITGMVFSNISTPQSDTFFSNNKRYLSLSIVYPHASDTLARIQQAYDSGCNAIQTVIDYRAVNGFNPYFNVWKIYSDIYDKAISLGMVVGLRILFDNANLSTPLANGLDTDISISNGMLNSDRMVGYGIDGVVKKKYQIPSGQSFTNPDDWENRVCESLNTNVFKNKVQSFTSQVMDWIIEKGYINQTAWVSCVYTTEQESGFPFYTTKDNFNDFLADYSIPMVDGYRNWLQEKYSNIQALNQVWASNYTSFSIIYPKKPSGTWHSAFLGKDGQDWFLFRTSVISDIQSIFYQSVKNKSINTNVINEFGSVFDILSVRRGTFDFAGICKDSDGIKINDAPEYDSRFSTDLIRTNMPNKIVMNEVEFYDFKEQICIKQFENSFKHGAKWINIFQFQNIVNANRQSVLQDIRNRFINTNTNILQVSSQSAQSNLSDLIQKGGVGFNVNNGVYSDQNNTDLYAKWKSIYSGLPVKIKLVNDLRVIDQQPYFNVKILGNSMVSHGQLLSSGWAGQYWGMASSAIDKDFVSLIRQNLLQRNSQNFVSGSNVFDFERNYKTIDFLNYQDAQNIKNEKNYNVIIVRFGENVDMSSYDKQIFALKTKQYIDTIKFKNAKVIITNLFWTNQTLDVDLQEIATNNGYEFVNLTGIYSYRGVNTAWQGGTNQSVLSNATDGIKDHPNDLGMQLIANRILTKI